MWTDGEMGAHRPAVHHPHLDLDHRRRTRPRVTDRHAPLARRRHEAKLDGPARAVVVRLPERSGQHAAADAAVDIRDGREAGELVDCGADRVERRGVPVAAAQLLALLHHERHLGQRAEHCVILDLRRPRIERGTLSKRAGRAARLRP